LGFVYYFLKTWVVYFVNLWMRFSLPRFRIDQMMAFNWKILTPMALVILMTTALLDKLLPAGQPILRVGGFLVLNVILLVGISLLISKLLSRRPRPVVAPTPRPVARR
jgi:NADH-quinone oxidoreductase subunit H